MRNFLCYFLSATALSLCAASAQLGRVQEKVPETPPRDVRLVEKKADQLSNHETGPLGRKALELNPAKWKHAETENFIVHYRRVTEAQRAVREIEFNLWFVAKSLGAGKERYAKKSHVYIFQDEKEWLKFLTETSHPLWSASFAYGDDLFLHVGGAGEGFDSHLLAHETTHAVVARLYPDKRWPLWLNEGFAEYMGSASIAARKKQYLKSLQNQLHSADMPIGELTALTAYPSDRGKIEQLYQSSERVVRFLMTQYPKDRITLFVDAVLNGNSFEAAVIQVYGDQVNDFAGFEKQYGRFAH